MEVLREEEVLALEEAILRRLEERLTPIMHQVAVDAAKRAMHDLRLDLMSHISRHETSLRHLSQMEDSVGEIPRLR